jgi:hypothetical protein
MIKRRVPERRSFGLLFVLLAAQADAGDVLLRAPLEIFGPEAGLSAGERSAFERGRVLVKILDSDDRSEVVALATLRLHASAARFVAGIEQVEARRGDDEVLAIGRFGTLPSVGDLSGLGLERRELESLRKCRPRDCDLRLSSEWMARFRGDVDWAAADHAARAASLWRATLAAYAADYAARGSAALTEYHDNPQPVRVADSLRRLVERFDGLKEAAPELERYLLEFPAERPDSARDFLYWLREKFWMKSVLSLNHVTLLERSSPRGPLVLVATRQIYANHYFDSHLGLTAFVEDVESGTSVLISLSRSRADVRPSGFTWIERALVRRLVRGRLESQLQALRRRLEAP